MFSVFERVCDWMASSPTAQATGLAMVISALRTIYDGKETNIQRVTLEAALCGCLTLVAGSGVKAMGWPPEWTMVFGGVLAYIGITIFKSILIKFLKTKAEIQDGPVN